MNEIEASYDLSQLEAFFAGLTPKERKKALKGGVRKCANKAQRQAVTNMRSSTNARGKRLHPNKGMEKGIRKVIFRKELGFRVTIGTKVKKARNKGKSTWSGYGQISNRHGKEKPLLIWAEAGSEGERKTRARGFSRKKRGHSTGTMPAYRFMERTKDQLQDKISVEMQENIKAYMTRLIKKNGK